MEKRGLATCNCCTIRGENPNTEAWHDVWGVMHFSCSKHTDVSNKLGTYNQSLQSIPRRGMLHVHYTGRKRHHIRRAAGLCSPISHVTPSSVHLTQESTLSLSHSLSFFQISIHSRERPPLLEHRGVGLPLYLAMMAMVALVRLARISAERIPPGLPRRDRRGGGGGIHRRGLVEMTGQIVAADDRSVHVRHGPSRHHHHRRRRSQPSRVLDSHPSSG